MDKSEFAICIEKCTVYFQFNCSDRQILYPGDLVQISSVDTEQAIVSLKIFHINYETKLICVNDKCYFCEQIHLATVPLKLFRFLVSVNPPMERIQLLRKSHVLCSLRNQVIVELDRGILKYFKNIVCQVIYIGELPEMGVGDFIGIKLMNCSLPLLLVGSQSSLAKKYTHDTDAQDVLFISASDLIKFYIKEIWSPPIRPVYKCSNCKTTDNIIHLRDCSHRICKECLIDKFQNSETLEISCDLVPPCSKIISLEHYIFLYQELAKVFNENSEKQRKLCFKCNTKTDDICNITNCEHEICKSCAVISLKDESQPMEYCEFLLNDGNKCKATIQMQHLKLIMSREDIDAYEERILLGILERTPNSRRCKTPKCKYYWIIDRNLHTKYFCKLCNNYNCLKCDAVHNASCKEYERTILDGPNEELINELLAKLTVDEIKEHEIVRNGTVTDYPEAERFRLLQLKYPNYEESDLLWAIRQSDDITFIERLLNFECNYCKEIFSHNNLFTMITCDHTFCKNCAKMHFTIQITEKTIKDCVCPTCNLPELDEENSDSEYFELMLPILQTILDKNSYDLLERKIRDKALAKIVNFVWCIKCENGIDANPNLPNVTCDACDTSFCATCKELWQDQHAGITCEQFKQWKKENDPVNQIEGVTNYLEKNGIECPSCKFKYSLAKGGCLHFTCTRCAFQFCYGCRQPMLSGAKCTKYNDCVKKGIHAHHPRNCLSILRDCAIGPLEMLLTNAGMNFVGMPQNGINNACQIPIQIELMPSKKVIDGLCDKPAINQNIGLCEQHYKEGVIDLIYKSKIDPIDILDVGEAKAELIRNHIELPPRSSIDTDATYRDKCIAEIKRNIPLV